MQSDRSSQQRREPERSLTWPPPNLASSDTAFNLHKCKIPPPKSTLPQQTTYIDGTFEDDLDSNPQSHFLSPVESHEMYEYDDWAEDSDSETEEVEWDAGITDFALFDDDRRRAQERKKPLPSKWSEMLAKQASALQRAVQRNREDSNPDPVNRPLAADFDGVPNLTPDASPELRDDLDVESYHGQTIKRPEVPNYLTLAVTPPDGDEDSGAAVEDGDLPLSVYVARKQQRGKRERKLQRPGMRHSRTMSGQIHAWRRPSWNMYTLGEDSEAEDRAEQAGTDGEDDVRGRR